MLGPEQLDEVAWALDILSKLTRSVYGAVLLLDQSGLDRGVVEIELTTQGKPVSVEDAKKLIEWVEGSDMQDDLRAAAEELRSMGAR